MHHSDDDPATPDRYLQERGAPSSTSADREVGDGAAGDGGGRPPAGWPEDEPTAVGGGAPRLETPSPFRPHEVTSPLPAGWGRPVLFAGAALLILLFAGLAILTLRADRLLAWSLDAMESAVIAELPADHLPEGDRQRLADAFSAARARAAAGEIDPAALQRVQRRFLTVAGQDPPTREALADLAAALEELAEKDEGTSNDGGQSKSGV